MEQQFEEQQSLVPDEVSKLLQQVIGQKQTILCCALARIHTANSGSAWTYSNLQGLLCLIWDREMDNTPFLRMFDTESFELLFDAEMYIDFDKSFMRLTDLFYYFEYMGYFIGVQFASKLEGQAFDMKIHSQSLKSSDIEVEKQEITEKVEKKEGLFGFRQKAKKIFGSLLEKTKNNKNLNAIQESIISKPLSVKHDLTLSFDQINKQLDFSQLSDQWIEIFQSASITPEDLMDKQIAPMIYQSIIDLTNSKQLEDSKGQSEVEQKQQSSANKGNLNLMQNNNQHKQGELNRREIEGNQQEDKKAFLDISNMDQKAQENLSIYLSKCIEERRKQLNVLEYSSSFGNSETDDN